MDMERSPKEIFEMVLKRKAHVVALALAGLLVASAVAVVKPKVFRSETQMRVRSSGELADPDALAKVQAATRDIKNVTNFERVVKQLNLDADLHGLPESERIARRGELVEGLIHQSTVNVEQVAGGLFVVTIAHEAGDSETSHRVVSELSTGYEQDSYERPLRDQEKSVDTHRREEESALQELERISDEFEAFQSENAEFLDDQAEQLRAKRDEIREIQDVQIAQWETDLAVAQEDLASEPKFIDQISHEADPRRVAEAEKRVAAVRDTLTRLTVEEKKTENHPRVKSHTAMLELAEADLDRIKNDKRKIVEKMENKAHLLHKEAVSALQSKLGIARKKLAVLRTGEQELVELTKKAPEFLKRRDELARTKQVAVRQWESRQEAHKKSREHLERIREQRHLTFEIMNPPSRPTTPKGAGAPVLALLGLAVGAAAGAGLAYVLDSMDHSFRDVESVTEFLGIPTLGAIHMIVTPEEEKRRSSRKRRTITLLGVLALAAGLAFAAAMTGGGPLGNLLESLR